MTIPAIKISILAIPLRTGTVDPKGYLLKTKVKRIKLVPKHTKPEKEIHDKLTSTNGISKRDLALSEEPNLMRIIPATDRTT